MIYSFESNTSSKILDIQLNEGPKGGICSINPLNGTIITLFTINCSNWIDLDGIKDYTIFGLFFVFFFSNKIFLNHSDRSAGTSSNTMFIQSSQSLIQLRLPLHTNLTVSIRDTFDGVTEYPLEPVDVFSDELALSNFIDELQTMSPNLPMNPIFQALTSTDRNTVGQMLFSISQILDDKNDQYIQFLVQSNIWIFLRDDELLFISQIPLHHWIMKSIFRSVEMNFPIEIIIFDNLENECFE